MRMKLRLIGMLAGFASVAAVAAEPKPLAKMDRVDALTLENALLKLAALERQAEPLSQRVREMADKYKLDIKRDRVNYDTGEIFRAEPNPPAAPPAPKHPGGPKQ